MNALSRRFHGTHAPPETRLGTWALALSGLAVAGTVALSLAFAAGLERGEGFTDNWFVTGAGFAILASAAAAAVTGLVALVRDHDRSWLVASATVLGMLVTLVTLQQVAEGLGWLTG
jgi:hypothetical protein